MSTGDTFSTNTNRYTKQSDILPTTGSVFNTGNNISDIRSRIFSNTNEQKDVKINQDSTPKKTDFTNQYDNKKSTTQCPSQKYVLFRNVFLLRFVYLGGGTFLYAGITIAVALIVFVLYLWLEK
jgi:hypothetical protein